MLKALGSAGSGNVPISQIMEWLEVSNRNLVVTISSFVLIIPTKKLIVLDIGIVIMLLLMARFPYFNVKCTIFPVPVILYRLRRTGDSVDRINYHYSFWFRNIRVNRHGKCKNWINIWTCTVFKIVDVCPAMLILPAFGTLNMLKSIPVLLTKLGFLEIPGL
jgi:hypothetical protein